VNVPAKNIEYAVRSLYPHKPHMDAHAALDTLIAEVSMYRQREQELHARLDTLFPGWQQALRRTTEQMSTAGT
jgi:hypothetical protein